MNRGPDEIARMLARFRVELFTAAQTLDGEDLIAFKELIRDITVALDFAEQHPSRAPLVMPPVDRTQVTTTDGRDPSVVEFKRTGMQDTYIVLTPSERAKGYVRPVRNTYTHEKCRVSTRMGDALAETYARDPSFYGATYCAGCGTHYPVGKDGEFVWDDGTKVGT